MKILDVQGKNLESNEFETKTNEKLTKIVFDNKLNFKF